MTGNTPANAPSHQAMEQAAEWFALLRSGEASASDRESWQSWLDSNNDNRQAWHYVEIISQRFAPIQSSPDRQAAATAYQKANSGQLSRRQVLLGLAVMAGSGTLAWAGWNHNTLTDMALAWRADYRTGTGKRRELTLHDGTRIWLNAASAVNQHYSADLRRLHLLSGEIMIQTAADPARPFVVDTPQGRLHALGTRFSVRLGETDTLMAVYEGAVEVKTAISGTSNVVQAGQQARFTGSTLAEPQTADPARKAWAQGILIADHIPLDEVVQELRRHRSGHLGLAPELAQLTVFGSFPLDDTDRALAMLANVLPIRIQHTLPWWVSIEPAEAGAE